jgi:hypothetical protein
MASRKAKPLPLLHAAQYPDNTENEHYSIQWELQTGEIVSAQTHLLTGAEVVKTDFRALI